MSGFFHGGCRNCLNLEPETVDTVARMLIDVPDSAEIAIYDDLIKDIKISQGLCLQTYSLHQLFNVVYIRAAHSKEAALLDWTKNQHDGTEVGTIRFTANSGVGGSTTSGNHYINNNYSQLEDKFSVISKFGGYITADFNNRICGFNTTAASLEAAQMTLSLTLGDRIYDSWGANPQQYFNTAGAGMREIVRAPSAIYNNNGTIAARTKLYQGFIDMTGGVPSSARTGFDLNFYSLASNQSNRGIPNGTPIQINTIGLCMFEFSGSYLIRSERLVIAVEKYLTLISAI